MVKGRVDSRKDKQAIGQKSALNGSPAGLKWDFWRPSGTEGMAAFGAASDSGSSSVAA